MGSSASASTFTTLNSPLMTLPASRKLTLPARAESACAAPASLGCEQADCRRWLGVHRLLQRTEFCRGGRERRKNFNRNSSSASKLKIKLYHKGQCDQAQLTVFFFFLPYLSTLYLCWRGSHRWSWKANRVLYQWVFLPLRKEENPFKKDNFQGQSSLSESCAYGWQIQLCSLWLVERSGQAAALIITVLCT